MRTTHDDLDAVARPMSAERTGLADVGLSPSLLIDLANLIGCDVVFIAETLVELFLVRARGPEFSDRDQAALTVLPPHLGDANRDSERRRQNPEPRLTARQQEVLILVAEGSTNAQIASRLSISAGTVRKHLENTYRILGVSNRIAAISTLTTRRPYQSACS